MCGRFHFSAEEDEQVKEIIAEVSRRLYGSDAAIRTGEIFPTNTVPVLVQEQGELNPHPMSWGFPKFDGKGVVINARSETVLDKRMFKSSVLSRRCVIPTTGFYEWKTEKDGRSKTKFIFHLPGTKLLHIAGFYNRFQLGGGKTEDRFVILTTEANDSMVDDEAPLSLFPDDAPRKIHDRMPVVLRPEECREWLADDADFEKLFDREQIKLIKQVA